MDQSASSAHFEEWPANRLAELEANRDNGHVGNRLVFESDQLRIWQLSIEPGGRLPFHKHVLNYFWTSLAPGRAQSRYGDGKLTEISYTPGDTKYYTFKRGQYMLHDLENVGETTLVFVTVEFKMSENEPLAL